MASWDGVAWQARALAAASQPPKLPSPRAKLNALLNDPDSSLLARWVAIWVMCLIVCSTVAFIAQTLPEVHVDGGPELKDPLLWAAIELFVVLQFSLEYVLRLWCAADRSVFVVQPLNVIDLMAFAPFYVELFASGEEINSSVLRCLRLVRVVRILRLAKYAESLRMFGRCARALPASYPPCFWVSSRPS